MVNTCVVVGCNYGYDKYSGISIHRFPVEENRKALWILALKRENWKPSCHSSVCGKHFQTGRPSKDENHPDFVPNIFPVIDGKRKKYRSRRKDGLKRKDGQKRKDGLKRKYEWRRSDGLRSKNGLRSKDGLRKKIQSVFFEMATSLDSPTALHSGKPADLYDINNPDWVPSLKMGYKKIEACVFGSSTEKIVTDEVKKGGFRRKKLLLDDGEIRINASKTVSSPNETRALAENIPIEYFQGSEIFSTETSCTTDNPVIRWTCSKIIEDSDTKEGILNKENTDINLKTEQNLSSVKEIFTYKNLLKNLQLIKKPNDFWSISPIPNAIICARWSENYTCEKKLVISNSLTVRVFLKEKWEINLSELMNVTCLDDISNLLEKVENYKIIQFEDLK